MLPSEKTKASYFSTETELTDLAPVRDTSLVPMTGRIYCSDGSVKCAGDLPVDCTGDLAVNCTDDLPVSWTDDLPVNVCI